MLLGTNGYPAYYMRDTAWWMGLLPSSVSSWNDNDSFVFNTVGTGIRPFVFQAGGTGRTSGTVLMYIDNTTGNVGIGTTGPNYDLDVAGDIRATGTIYGGFSLTGDIDLKGNNLYDSVGGSYVHATAGIGVADSLTTLQNSLPATQYSAYIQGDVRIGSDILGTGADIAEKFEVDNIGSGTEGPGEQTGGAGYDQRTGNEDNSGNVGIGPGDVVVATDKVKIALSTKAYDKRVLGVVSTDPTMVMAEKKDGLPVAMTGSVPVKVVGPVAVGDLLTTSDMPGHAMACDARERCTGAIIGKALESLDGGEGTIRMLVLMN